MNITKLIILLCCTYRTIASKSHTIPVEEYSTELQDLGQHVEYKETPVRVIKITKTVAVKVPVPYPVKVIEKVPYPVHVAKPYPVPVPQIVRIPHEQAHAPAQTHAPHLPHGDHSYNVHENERSDENEHGFQPAAGHFGGQESYVNDEQPAAESYHGHVDKDDSGSAESKAYDHDFNQYLHSNGGHGAGAFKNYYH